MKQSSALALVLASVATLAATCLAASVWREIDQMRSDV